MKFGCWEVPDIDLGDTIERYDKAIKIPSTDIDSINYEDKTAIVHGSIDYFVSLKNCTCPDFKNRKRAYGHSPFPCKHMLYLAINLDIPFNIPEFNPEVAVGYDIEEEASRLADRWRSGQLSKDAMISCGKALRKSLLKIQKYHG